MYPEVAQGWGGSGPGLEPLCPDLSTCSVFIDGVQLEPAWSGKALESSVWQDVAFLYLRRCALLQGQGGTCCAPGIPLSRSEGSHVSPTQRGLLRPTGVCRKAARSPGIGFNMFECWELRAHTVSSLAWVTREALPYSLLLLLQRILLSRECSARI